MDTDRRWALSFVPGLEVPGLTARRGAGGGAAGSRRNHRGRKYSSKNFLKKSAIKRWLCFPTGYFYFSPTGRD
ncbi:hypothetical protein, partial [Sphingomonas sp.]|uniref:hypothetical protein n=1 Tax=Sphingomonas sp. TaxID=28214 RepID=UPI0025D5B433